jgi:hypothetical protein
MILTEDEAELVILLSTYQQKISEQGREKVRSSLQILG